ncbi:MAG: competence/damage-inducible protein A [Candidatus Marinimicrobia bacterium]|nr:competence/damage-inducible protein A [Candidatus Neomarinimicrobiota bacterium]
MNDHNQKIAEIINIGDELLAGHTVNTNATWMSKELKNIGVKVIKHVVIADEKEAIIKALDQVEKATDYIFITGGLGPTEDDRTKAVITSYFGGNLVFSEEAYKWVEEFFKKRGRIPSERNKGQAVIPDNAERIINKMGTASGMIFRKDEKSFFVMPGVPYEMQNMMTESILPELSKYSKVLNTELQINTFGLPESEIADRIMAVMPDIEKELSIGYYPSVKGITLRLGGSDKLKVEEAQMKIQELLGDSVYSLLDESMAEIVVNLCKDKGLIITVAESCTGGAIADMITNISGSSSVFKEGFIVYSNEAKIRSLGVDPHILDKYGAVSAETVEAMVKGLKNKTGADIAIGVSGIAGPDGATPGKPVGLIYLAIAYKEKIHIQKLDFNRGRKKNKEYAARAALNRVRLTLIDDE